MARSRARIATALLALVLAPACARQLPEGVREIDSAYLVLGAARPTGARLGGFAVSLPDYWSAARRGFATEGWYRMGVDLQDASQPLAVMILEARLNAELFFNGTSLGRVGRFEAPMARSQNVPLYYRVPDVLLREGYNEIEVHLATSEGFPGRLRPLWVGPETVLLPVFERENLIRGRGPRAALAVAFLLALLLFAESLSARPDRRANFFLGLVALAMGLSGAGYFVTETDVPSRVWEWGIGCLTH